MDMQIVMPMRVLVTGAAGLYGTHLVDLLIAQEKVEKIVGIDNFSRNFFEKPFAKTNSKKFEIINQDYTKITKEFIDKNEFDTIVHLAAFVSIPESIDFPQKYFENNERGTFDLSQMLLKTKSQPALIYASSPEVYGNPERVPMDENHPLKPKSTYSVTKLAAEKHCMSLWEWYKYPAVTVRNFNTYGENQNIWGYSAVIPAFIEAALKNKPLRIEGDGAQTRDFLYVKDAVDAYWTVMNKMQKAKGEIFNIGTGKETKIIALAKKTLEATKSKSTIQFVSARKGDLPALCADIKKIKTTLGWEPKVSLSEGLTRTADWYKKFV